MPVTHSPRRAPRGFTLLELMIIVVVVAVILTLAAPAFSDMIARQRVRSINAELVTDLRFARSEAVKASDQLKLYFSSNDSLTCYSVYKMSGGVGFCDCRNLQCFMAAPVKMVQVPRSTGVTVNAVSSAPGGLINIYPYRDNRRAADVADLSVDVVSARSGQLRTRMNEVGQIQVCTPDGSISGAPAC